jgi:uncharacterized protein (TIGR03067 family)
MASVFVHYESIFKDPNMKLVISSAVALLAVASFASAASAIDDLELLQGAWTMVSGEMDGEPLPAEEVKTARLFIDGDKHVVEVGDMKLVGTHKLDQAATPKQIDALDSSGPTKGRNFGIYEFTPNGDFRVAFSPTGEARPTDFVSEPGSGIFVHVWRRLNQ